MMGVKAGKAGGEASAGGDCPESRSQVPLRTHCHHCRLPNPSWAGICARPSRAFPLLLHSLLAKAKVE